MADEFLNFSTESELSHHEGGTHVAMADGSIAFITRWIDAELLAAMLTKSGGERIAPGH